MTPPDDSPTAELTAAAAVEIPAPDAPKPIAFPHTYQLLFPVELKGKDGTVVRSVSSITLRRRPIGIDLRATDKAEGEAGKTILMIASVAGELSAVIDQLDVEDIGRLGELVSGSLPSGPPTGPTVSAT